LQCSGDRECFVLREGPPGDGFGIRVSEAGGDLGRDGVNSQLQYKAC